MKTLTLKAFVVTAVFAIGTGAAKAQFSISNPNSERLETQLRKDSIREASSINNPYFSQGRYMAERRQLRRDRNTIEFNGMLTLTYTDFNNWARGGQTTFAGRTAVEYKHLYKLDRLRVDYSFNARYGMTIIDGDDFKNEDVLIFHAGTNWAINRNWSYGATVDFRTQFSDGFKSITDPTLVSTFMAPGTLDIGGGFKYKHLKEKLEIDIAPVAGRMLFVLNEQLSNRGAHGIKAGDRILSTLGSSLRVNYEKDIIKDKFKYRTFLYGFTNYQNSKPDKKGNPGRNRSTVQFDNTLVYKLGKLFSVSAFLSTYYEDYSQTPEEIAADEKRGFNREKLQTNYILGLGLSYSFKNK